MEQYQQILNIESSENKITDFEYINRKLIKPNQDDQKNVEKARRIIQQLLFIDIKPLILHELGFVKEHIIYPHENESQFTIDFSNYDDKQLLRNDQFYKQKEICQEEIQEFVSKVQFIIKDEIDKKVEDISDEMSEVFEKLQLNPETKKSQVDIDLIFGISTCVSIATCLKKIQFYDNLKLRFAYTEVTYSYLTQRVYDLKHNNTYLLICLNCTEHFYFQLDNLLSINKCIDLNLYLAKIAYIDYDYQMIYVISGEYTVNDLLNVYLENNSKIPEQTIKLILKQIFQILLLFLEKKYYIFNLDFKNFGLFRANKNMTSFFIKYLNVISITNDLVKAQTELKFMNNNFFYKTDDQCDSKYLISEEMYLRYSIGQITQQIINLLLKSLKNKYENKQQDKTNIEVMKGEYGSELIKFLLIFLSPTGLKFYPGVDIKRQICLFLKEQNDFESLNLNLIEQHQLLNKITQIGMHNLKFFVPTFPIFVPNQLLPQLLQQASEYVDKIQNKEENLESYINTVQIYQQIFRKDIFLIINQLYLNNIPCQDEKMYDQLINIQQYFFTIQDSERLKNKKLVSYKNHMIKLIQKYFLKQEQISKYTQNRREQFFRNQLELIFLQPFTNSILYSLFIGDNQIDEQLDNLNLEEEFMLQKLQNEQNEDFNIFMSCHLKDLCDTVIIRLQYPSLIQYRFIKDGNYKINIENNNKYIYDKNASICFDYILYYFNEIIQQLRINNYGYIQEANKKISKYLKTFDRLAQISQSIMVQQIKCICMIMLDQDAEKELQILYDIYPNKIELKEKENNFIKRPQKELEELSQNISEYYLRNKEKKLIDYYSNLNLSQSKKQFYSFDELQAKVKIFEENNQSPLKDYYLRTDPQVRNYYDIERFQKAYNDFVSNIIQNNQQQYDNLEMINQKNKDLNQQQENVNQQNQDQIKLNSEKKDDQETLSSQETQQFKFMIDYIFMQQEVENIETFIQQNYQEINPEVTYNLKNLKRVNQDYVSLIDQTIQYSKIIKNQSTFDNQQLDDKLNKYENNYSTLEFNDLIMESHLNSIIETNNLQNNRSHSEQNKQANNICQLSENNAIKKNIKYIMINNKDQIETEHLINIGKLGKGGSGQVIQQFNIQNSQRYALKQYANKMLYFEEKYICQNLLPKSEDPNFKSLICNLVAYNDEKLQLLFELGICSLFKASKILKKSQNLISKQNLINLLFQLLHYNIEMQQQNLYHGDIKPQNIIIYEDENDQKAKQTFGYELQNANIIKIKLIDFQCVSNNPEDHFNWFSLKYKYMDYLKNKTKMNWHKILFAEIYSSCKVIYYLLSEDEQRQVDEIKFDYKILNEIIEKKEDPKEEYFFYFLNIFLGKSDVTKQLQNDGISIELLLFLKKNLLIYNKKQNKIFENDQVDELKRYQLKNIKSEFIPYIKNQSIEFQIMYAFYFKNKLNEVLSREILNNQNQNEYHKFILNQLQIISIYEKLTQPELDEIQRLMSDQFVSMQEDNFIFLLQIYCFLFSHGSQNHCQWIINIINSNIQEFSSIEEYPIINVVIRLIIEKNLSLSNIMNLLEQLEEKHFKKSEINLFYEFIFTKIAEFDDFSDQQYTKIQNYFIQNSL